MALVQRRYEWMGKWMLSRLCRLEILSPPEKCSEVPSARQRRLSKGLNPTTQITTPGISDSPLNQNARKAEVLYVRLLTINFAAALTLGLVGVVN
jgi:hypothetical protein